MKYCCFFFFFMFNCKKKTIATKTTATECNHKPLGKKVIKQMQFFEFTIVYTNMRTANTQIQTICIIYLKWHYQHNTAQHSTKCFFIFVLFNVSPSNSLWPYTLTITQRKLNLRSTFHVPCKFSQYIYVHNIAWLIGSCNATVAMYWFVVLCKRVFWALRFWL